MKKFNFPLQSVLFYDTFMQNREMHKLSALQTEYQDTKRACLALQEQYAGEIGAYQARCAKGIPVGEAAADCLLMEQTRRQILAIEERIVRLAEQVERQREALLAVTTDKMTVEKLRETSLAAYTDEVRKREEILIEEFVANGAVRAR